MKVVKIILALAVLPLIIYFSIFALHFSLLNKSGPGDAFMTPKFRKTLAGSADNANAELKPLNIFQKFNELNLQMYKSNATLTATHPYSSQWYTWPFMIRPIYYWNDSGDGQQSRIYFLGNPVIWWASTVAMLYLLMSVFQGLYRGIRPKLLPALLGGAYLLNMLPFIGISRAMFLYHYMIGLVFAIVALVYLVDRIVNKKRVLMILLIASIVSFVFFAPLTYGLPLNEKMYHARVWLSTWQ
jgi:dolichyl-phosphate-mannose--protein O-mannosyl transferase